jgi:hypothetical protein
MYNEIKFENDGAHPSLMSIPLKLGAFMTIILHTEAVSNSTVMTLTKSIGFIFYRLSINIFFSYCNYRQLAILDCRHL